MRTALLAVLLSLGLSGCGSTSNLPREKDDFLLEADEARVWERAREIVDLLGKSHFVADDPASKSYLEGICKRLYPDVDRQPSEFEVLILKDPSVNAFALPNGVICVNSGLLSAMESEAQLAIVLAHELAHFHARHALLGFRHLKAHAAFHTALGAATLGYGSLISIVGFPAAVSGHSRAAEREADELGWQWYLEAGYAKEEAPLAFVQLQRYAKENKVEEPYFFGSHPRLQDRLDAMTRLAATAEANGPGVVGVAPLFETMRGIWLDNCFLDFDLGNLDRAERLLARFDDAAPDARDVRYCYAKAELLRRQGDASGRDEAVALCKRGLRESPSHAGLKRTLGQLYYESQDWSAALPELRDAVTLDPDYPRNPFILQYISQCEARISEKAL